MGCGSVSARILTPEEALGRLEANGQGKFMTRSVGTPELVYTEISTEGSPTVYIYNRGSDDGYLILSADDCASPLLGYSDSGRFDLMSIPPAMKWWLHEYSRQISVSANLATRASRSSLPVVKGGKIDPMVKTKWDQGKPYNDMCPEINGVKCVTGCVATAMAQIMYYHKYPEKGVGTVSISLAGTSSPTSLDLSQEAFRWNDMLDSYEGIDYTEEQSSAVAYLMKACGYSVGMDYSTTESGASSFNVGRALIDNFGYNDNISIEERQYYNSEAWNQMVYDELAAGRPVLYSGQSEGGGHAFVCDGYNGDGYFHINWGWGGMSDGFFLLQSLNPSDLGIGGGTGGGFSFDQSILKGVQKESAGTVFIPNLTQGGNITGNKSSTSRIFIKAQGYSAGWWNMSYKDIEINIGVRIEPENVAGASVSEVIGFYNDSELKKVALASLRGFTSLSFMFPTTYPDGKYKVTVCTQDASSENAPWIPVVCSEYSSNSFHVTKNGAKYTVEFSSSKSIGIEDAELLSSLHYGALARMSVTFTNNTDVELSQTIAPVLMKQGENKFEGTGFPVLLKPGETLKKEMVVEFESTDNLNITESTDFLLKFQNVADGTTLKFSKTVTMLPKVSFTLSDVRMSIPGVEPVEENGQTVNIVNDKSAICLDATVSCADGFFGYPVYAFLFPGEGGQNLSGMHMTPYPILGAGESQTISGKLDFDQGEAGKLYFFALYYYDGGWKRMSDDLCIFRISSAGIGSIEGELGLSIGYDAASGMATAGSPSGIAALRVISIAGNTLISRDYSGSATADISLSSLPKGVYLISVTDTAGKTRTMKITK